MRPTTRAVGRCPAALRAFIPGKVERGSASVSMLCLALTRLAKIRRSRPCPKGPRGQKRPADLIGNAVRVMQVADALPPAWLAQIECKPLWGPALLASLGYCPMFDLRTFCQAIGPDRPIRRSLG